MGKNFVSEKVNTPEGVVSWPVVFDPEIKVRQDGSKQTVHRCELIFDADKADALNPLRDLAYAAGVNEWGPDDSEWPQFQYKVIRETAEKPINSQTGKPWEGYEHGKLYISCQSSFRPPLVDTSGRAIIDPAEFYGGCRAIFCVNAYTYDYLGKRGIKFGLVAILKTGDGKPFGAERPDPSQIFKAMIKPGATASGAVAAPAGAAGARRQL